MKISDPEKPPGPNGPFDQETFQAVFTSAKLRLSIRAWQGFFQSA